MSRKDSCLFQNYSRSEPSTQVPSASFPNRKPIVGLGTDSSPPAQNDRLAHCFSRLPWPCGVAEPCSRHREKRRALFEPFGIAQDKLREFARRRSRRTAKGTRRATVWPTWFWPLLPKQKWVVARGRNPALHLGVGCQL